MRNLITHFFISNCFLFSIAIPSLAQNITNRGTEFWVGYGHHQYMEPSCTGAAAPNDMNMVLYLSAEEPAIVTVTIDSSGPFPATWWKRTYTIPANTVISTENLPKGAINAAASGSDPNFDARLIDPSPAGTGGEGIFRNKGIHIESNVPIVAYAHIYGAVSSGATMLLPIETWRYTYTSLNSEQQNADRSYSWMYVIAKENFTRVQITPSATSRLGKPAGVPFNVELQKGQIYQLIGDAVCATGNGPELTGTTVKSILGSDGQCHKVAVFSGSSRTGGETLTCGTGSGRDNDMQQGFPEQTWGKRYLTAPFSKASGSTVQANQFQISVYKVVVTDPTTIVKRNGTTLSGLINNKYYKYSSNTADYITADKPVLLGQYMSGTSICNGGQGDPEMIYLSPIEQAIKRVGCYRNTREAITVDYVTLIVPTAGVPSLKIDGSNTFSHTYPHPNLSGFTVVIKGWVAAQAQILIDCDSAFTGITYGLGGAESYGYNVGANFLDLINAGPDQLICSSAATMSATASTFGTGSWTMVSGPNLPTIVLPTSPTTTITGMIPGTYIFRWAIDNGDCTISDDSVQITITGGPIIATAGADQVICAEWMITLTGNDAGVGTGGWTLVNGPNTPIITSANSASTTVTGLIPGFYIFRWTITSGSCPSTSDEVGITVYPELKNKILPLKDTICIGQNLQLISADLSGGNAPNYIIQWQQSSDGINWSDITGAISSSYLYSGSTNIYLRRYVQSLPCSVYSDTAHIVVESAIINNIITGNATICLNSSAPMIVGTVPNGGNGIFIFQWEKSIDNGITWTLIIGATAKDYNPGTLNLSTSYRRRVSTTRCTGSQSVISNQVTIFVTVASSLNLTISPNDTICIGSSSSLFASGATTYAWSPTLGLSSTVISNPIATPLITTTYRVIGTDANNCNNDTAFVSVIVGQYPKVDLGPDLVLSSGSLHPIISTIINGPIRSWLWTPPRNLSCSSCPLPVASVNQDISYKVTVTNIYGCAATDSLSIKVFCKSSQVFIPNAFTPDGDGLNDVLMVRGTGITSVKSFRIFNRWGELVFERINFVPNVTSFGWDGKINGIVGAPEVYVYTAEVLCENGLIFTMKGNITILK